MAWTTETRQDADAAWIEYKAAVAEWRGAVDILDHEGEDRCRDEADAAYHRWEAACRAAGLL
jgi:hypothetical protein